MRNHQVFVRLAPVAVAALLLSACSGSHHSAAVASSSPSPVVSSTPAIESPGPLPSSSATASSPAVVSAGPASSPSPVSPPSVSADASAVNTSPTGSPSSLDLSALGPVILVPGYGGSDTVLETLANRLHSAGRTTILLALPDDATGDLNAQAGVLAARVTVALKAGAPSVDLVGYSAGGIVIALFVAAHPKEVRQIVTIGSPLHGTQIAELGVTLNAPASICPTACRQMAPGSAVLTAVTAAEPAKTGVPWTSMWTADDQVVLPPDSARFTGATNIVLQDVCADDTANHLNLPADQLVAGLTLRALDTSGGGSPSASDCSSLRALGAGS
jgi:pimeloyl-ACP methyl ester carboxylesterase